jgi:hypothetical protein
MGLEMAQQQFWLFFFFEMVYIAQTGLELAVFLPQPSRRWGYRLAPPYPASLAFGKRQFLAMRTSPHTVCVSPWLPESEPVENKAEWLEVFCDLLSEITF